MSKRFENFTADKPAVEPEPKGLQISAPRKAVTATSQQANRQGKKQIGGYFSHELHTAMKITAAKRGITLQEALIEAMEAWLRSEGESPVGG